MFFREFRASRQDRKLLGSFRNLSGRLKRKLDGIGKEFGVVVTPNEHSRVPTIEHLQQGASAYDISSGNDHLATVSLYIDEFCGNIFLQASGPLLGDKHAFCAAADYTLEMMMTNLTSLLHSRTAKAA